MRNSFHCLPIPYHQRSKLVDAVGTFFMDDYGNVVRLDFDALRFFIQ